jgi:hypothetical protein
MNFADLYILNVGHGSCAVIDHTPSGRLTMIDINNAKALPEVVEPLRQATGPGSAISGTSRQKFPTRITLPHIRAYSAWESPINRPADELKLSANRPLSHKSFPDRHRGSHPGGRRFESA